jgi:hypothetical protein
LQSLAASDGSKFLSQQAKMEQEIAAERGRAAEAGGLISDKDLSARTDAIKAKYEKQDKAGEALAKTYGSLIAASLENERALTIESAGVEKLTQGEKRLLDLPCEWRSIRSTLMQGMQ